MKIELWCDIICPYCGLAEWRLENALAAFEHRAETQVIYRSFQLHPDLDRDGITQRDLLLMRVSNPAEVERIILRPLEQAAEREGLTPYRTIDRTLGPTDHAHELLAYASDKGLHAEAWNRMFRAHFGEARKLWTLDQVADFAAELGLDPVEVRAVLESRKYREQVENDQREARRLGATGTPFMLIARKYSVSGAQTTDQLLSALRHAWLDQHQAQ
jgi:predicted DsbA family dithiol-disulfide isomerase